MNKKEEKEINKICKDLDVLFDVAINLEKYCKTESPIRIKQTKKTLLKYLNKIQKIADKLLEIDIVIQPGKVAELFKDF